MCRIVILIFMYSHAEISFFLDTVVHIIYHGYHAPDSPNYIIEETQPNNGTFTPFITEHRYDVHISGNPATDKRSIGSFPSISIVGGPKISSTSVGIGTLKSAQNQCEGDRLLPSNAHIMA